MLSGVDEVDGADLVGDVCEVDGHESGYICIFNLTSGSICLLESGKSLTSVKIGVHY